jgi:hypothetical protein
MTVLAGKLAETWMCFQSSYFQNIFKYVRNFEITEKITEEVLKKVLI